MFKKMNQISRHKIINIIDAYLPSFPIISLLIIYSLILHTRIAIGYWPRGDSDPNYTTFQGILMLHDIIATYAFIAIPVLSFVSIVFAIIGIANNEGLWLKRLTMLVVPYGLWWFIIWIDPGRYIHWLLD
jgi:hypothetical protein